MAEGTRATSKPRDKRYRVLAPADWRERHLAQGWDEERDGPIPTFGIEYPPERRAEAGEIAEGLPAESVPWLIADGLLEEVV